MGMDSRLVRLQVLREQSFGRPERPAVRRHTCSPRRQHARSCFAWRCLDRISGGREGFLSLLVHSVFAGFEYRVPMCFRRELATKGTTVSSAQVLARGAADYLIKLFGPDTFLACLERATRKGGFATFY